MNKWTIGILTLIWMVAGDCLVCASDMPKDDVRLVKIREMVHTISTEENSNRRIPLPKALFAKENGEAWMYCKGDIARKGLEIVPLKNGREIIEVYFNYGELIFALRSVDRYHSSTESVKTGRSPRVLSRVQEQYFFKNGKLIALSTPSGKVDAQSMAVVRLIQDRADRMIGCCGVGTQHRRAERTLPQLSAETQRKIAIEGWVHPLDARLDKEIENAGSPSSQTARIYEDYLPLWDAEMNRIYKEWLLLLPKKSQNDLLESQKAWLKYRDANKRMIDMSFGEGIPPTMYQSFNAYAVMSMTRERALELIQRCETWKMLQKERSALNESPEH